MRFGGQEMKRAYDGMMRAALWFVVGFGIPAWIWLAYVLVNG